MGYSRPSTKKPTHSAVISSKEDNAEKEASGQAEKRRNQTTINVHKSQAKKGGKKMGD